MEDEVGKEISELMDRLHDIANQTMISWPICTPKFASLILENNRRKDEEIEMLRGAIKGWRRASGAQQDKIEELLRR